MAGIGTADFVVAYDDVGGWVAARLWWMLDNLGHERRRDPRRRLSGLAAARASRFDRGANAGAPASLRAGDRWSHVIDRDELRRPPRRGDLIDARAPRAIAARSSRSTRSPATSRRPSMRRPRWQPRARRPVPAARGRAGRAASAARRRGRERPVVTSCGSGVSACHNALAMRVAGLPGSRSSTPARSATGVGAGSRWRPGRSPASRPQTKADS